MAETGRRTEARGKGPLWAGVGLAIAAAVGLALWFGGGTDAGTSAPEYVPVSGFRDVHGLAVSPEDPRHLYVATHSGLIRAVGDGNWSRVGRAADDLMGFTMHPTDAKVFWSSGHPASPNALERNLGVRKSADGGFTWTRIALEGVDLHALAVSPADPARLWGASGPRLWTSGDGGATWELLSSDGPGFAALAGHPREAATVLAATPQGLLKSADGGRTWTSLAGPASAVAFARSDPATLYLAGAAGLSRSTDGGATWTALGAPAGAIGALAVHPADARVLYAATYQAAIYKSTDRGATWTTVKTPG